MKRFLLLFALLFAATSIRAQEVEYDQFFSLVTMEYYALEAELADDGSISTLFIEVEGENHDEVFIKLKGSQLNAFHSAMRVIRDKFLEWKGVAEENGVTDYARTIQVDFPEVEGWWYCENDWKDSYAYEPDVTFIVDDEGDCYVMIDDYVSDWEDEYETEEWSMYFNARVDFDDIINQTSVSHIRSKLREASVDSLFK